MRQQTEPARPGAPSARDRGLRGGTYGPASTVRCLSRQELEAYAREHGEKIARAKPKKFATPKRARQAKQRARKRSANMWQTYG